MTRHSTLLFLLGFFGMSTSGNAQFWDRLHRILNGDTAAGPAYDTAYIVSYREDLVLSPVVSYQGSSIELQRKDGGRLSYETNTPVQYGLAFDYKWLGVEATFTIPGLSRLDPQFGPTNTTGLGFGFTGRRWWFRNFFRTSEGYSVTDPELVDPDWTEGDPYPYRGDIRNFTYMATINHGFNTERFSYNAATWQMERQKKSAGSWTAGATLWYSSTACDGGLIPEFDVASYEAPDEVGEVGEVQRWVISITGGYAHTWSLWRHGFINAMLVPGIGAQQRQLEAPDGSAKASGWDVAGTAEFHLGAGYVGDRWYLALTSNRYVSAGTIVPDVRLGSTFVNMRLTAGWRFKNIKPIWPRVGL